MSGAVADPVLSHPSAAARRARARSFAERNQGLLFAVPALLALAALIGYPLVDTAVLSFTNDAGKFVGWSNYQTILEDDTTSLATYNSVIYVGGSLVLQLVLGTIAGILLNQRFIGRGPLRTVLLIPWVVPGIVAATTWAWMFHIEFGIVNYALQKAHVIPAPVGWLTDPQLVLPSVMAVNIWKMFPFVGIMVLAGLQAIPETLYEAARVDGATWWQELRHVTLPLMLPTILVTLVFRLIMAVKVFDEVYLLTGGGPGMATEVLSFTIYRRFFTEDRAGYGAAVSVVALFAVAALIILALAAARRRGTER